MSQRSEEKKAVMVLGATGLVGQRLISLLEDHPIFQVVAIAASPRSAGKQYKDAVNWNLASEVPKSICSMVLRCCSDTKALAAEASIAFCALDASVASTIEAELAKAGVAIFSNTRCNRRAPYVPILLPFVNPSHLDAIKAQRLHNEQQGFVVCNANCSSTGLVVALQALQPFGLLQVFVVTMQACSGAGFPGIPSLSMIDNVIPYINGEEEKLQYEPCKMLGHWDAEGECFQPLAVRISASCNRVPVQDGHLATVSVKLAQSVSVEKLKLALASFRSPVESLKLPSSPEHPIRVHDKRDRPQPRLDRDIGAGFTVSVGNVRSCNLLDFKFTLLSHNTVIGAAGGAVLNAELAAAKGVV